MKFFIYIFVFILVMFQPFHIQAHKIESNHKHYHVLIIHSYSKNLTTYSEFGELVQKELEKKNIYSSIHTIYLNCEQAITPDTEVQMYHFLDSIQSWQPDIILVNDDQATFTLMSCNHPLVKKLPIVFSGVNFPNWKLLKEHPNVTGYWDKPEYLKNINLIEKLYGKSNILFFNDTRFIGKQAFHTLLQEVEKSDIRLYDGLYYPDKPLPPVISPGAFEKSALFTAKAKELNGIETMGIFKNNSYTACLQIILDFNVLAIGRLANVPNFTVINNGFNNDWGITGGYFTTLDIQTKCVADMAARILSGTPVNKIPITLSPKTYAFDWYELGRFHINIKDLPQGSIIYNLPLYIRYHTYIVIGGVLLLLAFIYIIVHLIFMYRRENKRKIQAQKNLVKEKNFLKLALEGGNTYAWRMENDNFIFENDFYVNNQIEAKPIPLTEFVEMVHPDDRKNLDKTIQDIHSGNIPKATIQCRFYFNQKQYTWWELRYNQGAFSSAENQTIIGLCINIQSFKEKENKLTILQEKAEEANKMKSAFLANMSHEIRTPLNAIVGFSNLLQEDDELSEEEKILFKETINKNSSLLLKLINDILELSRIESGRMSFTFENCRIDELLEELYQTHLLLIPPSVKFIKKIPKLPVIVKIDRHRLTQVITNLINNAVKFTTEGHILLGYQYNKPDNTVRIYVEDTGIGMSEDARQKVFERFYKENEFAQGTGLGLSISVTIVERLNGKIELQSEENKGSRFTITLPCRLDN